MCAAYFGIPFVASFAAVFLVRKIGGMAGAIPSDEYCLRTALLVFLVTEVVLCYFEFRRRFLTSVVDRVRVRLGIPPRAEKEQC